MSIKQQAARAVFWTAGSSWLGHVVSLFVFFILARLLSPEAFGLVALANLAIVLFTILPEQGLAEAIVQREEIDREHLDSAFWLQIALGVFMCGISLVFSPHLARLLEEPEYSSILNWLSLGLIIQTLSSTQAAILRRELKFKTLAIRKLVAVLVGGAVGVTMAFKGYGAWSLVGQQLSAAAAGALTLWAAADWRPSLRLSVGHVRDLFSYGIYAVGTALLSFVNRRCDDLLIGIFLGPVALGYYVVAYRILRVMTELLITVIATVAIPAFSRVQSDLPRLRRGFLRAIQLASLITFPAFCCVAAAAPDVIRVFGEKWDPAIPVVRVLALVGVVHTVIYLNVCLFKAVGFPSLALKFNAVIAVLNIVGFLLVVRSGILAVAIVYLVTNCLIVPLHIRKLCQLLDMRVVDYLGAILPSLAASILGVIGVVVISILVDGNLGIYMRLLTKFFAGGVAYLVAVKLAFPHLWDDSYRFIRESFSAKTTPAQK